MNQARVAELQLNTLRDALDRASKTATIAEGRARRALNDLQIERGRAARIEQKLNETLTRLDAAADENRRLRNLVGNVCKEREMMQRDMREMQPSAMVPDPFNHEIHEESVRRLLNRRRFAA
jgi:hypothetical protein